MAWGSSPVVSHAQCLGTNGGTSSGINTTGADTIFLSVAYQGTASPSVSDSNGNTWTLIRQHNNGFDKWNELYRSAGGAASVGSGHTFTVTLTTGVIGIAVTAFAGGATSSIDDVENSAGAVFTATIQPGSITPSAANTLIITGIGNSDTGNDPSAIGSSFTVAAHVASDAGAVGFGCGIAYLVQGAAAAVNPTWTISASSTHVIATIANFNAAAGGGGGGTTYSGCDGTGCF